MSEATLTPLAERLGVEPVELTALAAYDVTRLAHLDSVLERAMTTEDQAFDQALDDALRFIPRLLRGTAAKLLFPGGRHE